MSVMVILSVAMTVECWPRTAMVKTVDSDFERAEVRVVEPGAAAMLKAMPIQPEQVLS